jgi:hypothetical protein
MLRRFCHFRSSASREAVELFALALDVDVEVLIVLRGISPAWRLHPRYEAASVVDGTLLHCSRFNSFGVGILTILYVYGVLYSVTYSCSVRDPRLLLSG